MSLVAYASSDESEPDEPEPELEEEDVAAPMPRPTFSPCTQRSSLAAPAPQMLTPTFPPPLLLPSPIRDPRLQPSPPLPFGFGGFLPPTGVSPAEAPRIGEGLGLPSPQGPGLSLPPAVGSVGTPLRLPKPKKRTKPVRIAAPELHKDDSDSEEDEPAKKKIVLQGSSKETGLSALLPQPENLTVKETNRLLLLHAFSRKPSDVSSDAKPSRLASKTKPASLAPVFGTTTTTPSPSAIKAAARSAALQVTQEDDDSDEEVAPEKFFPSLTRLSHLELSHTLTLSSLSLKSCLQARNQSQLSRTMRPIAPLEFKMTAGSSGGPWMPKPRDDYSYNQFSTYDNANAAGAYYQDYYSGGCYPAPDLALVPPQEIAPDASFIDDESFKRLQGKRNRVREEINFVEIKGDDQLSGAQQWMTKSLTGEKTMKSFSTKKGEQPTGRQRRKHQTTYLIHQAEEQEQELELGLKNTWSENTLSRCQTQAKYGF